MHGLQAMVLWLEVVAHVLGPQQAAVGLVGPLVIGADKLGGLAGRLGADPATAVAAGIVEGADLVVPTAHHDNGIPAQLQRHVGTGLRHFGGGGGENPLPIPDMRQVLLVDTGVRIERLRQRPSGALGSKERGKAGGGLGHGR